MELLGHIVIEKALLKMHGFTYSHQQCLGVLCTVAKLEAKER